MNNKVKLFAALIMICLSNHLVANNMHQVLSTNMGMANFNITENASVLTTSGSESNAPDDPTASAISLIALNVVYEFMNYPKKSYLLKTTLPLMSSDGSGAFLVGAGMNFYISSMSSKFSINDSGNNLIFTPTLRYYWGPSLGVGYLIYNTETAKKSDIIFDLEVHGGLIYTIKKIWGIRAEFAASRGTGVASSTIGMKFFVGMTYFLEK
ncbi:MAG: hypothetical protein HOJ35_06775 [Bdellovibrionales bacterium]|jgi:hypothetical protein|nr:hypothetical protein [Bdellovibrionales bacterium]